VIGILAALLGRGRNRGGYQVDIALLDTALALNERRVNLAAMGVSTNCARADNNGVFSLFKASDVFFLVVLLRTEHFELFARGVGAESCIGDERFATEGNGRFISKTSFVRKSKVGPLI